MEPLQKQTVVISGELHSFIKQKAAEPENKGENIGSLVERAIRNYYGVDENGEFLLNKTPTGRPVKVKKE